MTTFHTASVELEKLNADMSAPIGRATEISELLQKYPDLLVYQSGKGSILCSASMNTLVDVYDQTENKDAPEGQKHIYVWPYHAAGDSIIYSYPPYFMVGTINDKGWGVEPNPRWNQEMDDAGIPNSVTRKVRSYLKSKPPISYT